MWMIEKRWTEKLFVWVSLRLTKSIKEKAHKKSTRALNFSSMKRGIKKTITKNDQEKCSIKVETERKKNIESNLLTGLNEKLNILPLFY